MLVTEVKIVPQVPAFEAFPWTANPVITLPFNGPIDNSPYFVRGMTGLDTERIDFVAVGRADSDWLGQETLYDPVVRSREIVVDIGFNPHNGGYLATYSALRDQLYKIIALSRKPKVDLIFTTPNDEIKISCMIVKIESDKFADEMTGRVTLFNDEDPIFRSTTRRTIDLLSGSNMYDLIQNPTSLTFADDLSTAPHGCDVRINVEASFTGTYVVLAMPDDMVIMGNVIGGLEPGDQLNIVNSPNYREVVRIRDDVRVPIAEAVYKNVFWPTIFPGWNPWALTPGLTFQEIGHVYSYWGV